VCMAVADRHPANSYVKDILTSINVHMFMHCVQVCHTLYLPGSELLD